MRAEHSADPRAVEIAREFASRVRDIVSPTEVTLFGSCARGQGTSESDIDLLVEVKTSPLPEEVRRQIDDAAWLVGFEAGRVLQTLVYTSPEIWETPRRSSPLIRTVQREGIAV